MDVEHLYHELIKKIEQEKSFTCTLKKRAGLPFLYISSLQDNLDVNELKDRVQSCAKQVIYKKRITFETHFVRQSNQLYVFRHRFYVPQEKMFCCGNLCMDCVLLRKTK